MQVLSLTKEELEQYGIAGCAMNIGETVPLNVDHEQRVGKLLCSSSETLLKQFPTNIAEDEEILKREGLPNRLRQSVNSRLSRKRCLKECMDIAKAWVERPTATVSIDCTRSAVLLFLCCAVSLSPLL